MTNFELSSTNMVNDYEYGSLANKNSLIRHSLGRPFMWYMMPQLAEPVPLNPNYGKRGTPATVIIDSIMQDRSSFIAGITKEQGE